MLPISTVIVALWQTKYANKKKIKYYILENNTIVNPDIYTSRKYIGLSITNTGNKKVILSSWGKMVSRNETIMILTDA